MRILVTGGSGFIGQALVPALLAAGDQVVVSSRQPSAAQRRLPSTVEVTDDIVGLADSGLDAVINLAGAGIADQRWSEARKRELLASRLKTTEAVVALCERAETPPKVLISASAVGFYGQQSDSARPVDESTPATDGFTHDLCQQWEAAALRAEVFGVRVARMRIGIVLGPGGGMMGRVLLPFKLGLGGRLGSGEQWMPWVHRDDVVGAIQHLLHGDQASAGLSGAFNVCAPNPVSNATFTQTLGQVLGRPTLLATPAPVLRLIFGEMSELLLEGTQMVPARLLASGYAFKFSDLRAALADVVKD
jgi:uncharacterized protein (TIGR01777 family)